MESSKASSTILMDTCKYCADNATKYVTGPFKNFVDSIKLQAPFGDFNKLSKDPETPTVQKIATFMREFLSFVVKSAFVVAATYTAVQLVNCALLALITTVACVILFERSQDEKMMNSIAVKLKEFWDSVNSPAVQKSEDDEAPNDVEAPVKKTDKDQIEKKLAEKKAAEDIAAEKTFIEKMAAEKIAAEKKANEEEASSNLNNDNIFSDEVGEIYTEEQKKKNAEYTKSLSDTVDMFEDKLGTFQAVINEQ